MKIRKACPEDIEQINRLYEAGCRYMRQNGNMTQWTTEYPNQEVVENDIQKGRSYLVERDGKAVGVFYYDFGENPEPGYNTIDGAWLDHEPYGVIHRIASDGSVSGMMDFCTNWALEQCPSLRIDTHKDNFPMRNALERNGFSYCGVIIIENGTERIAFQKLRKE